MTHLWPWLTIAAVGALHGLNPASGWVCAAAWGVRSHDRAQALRALMPIAVGHGSSTAVVAAAVALGVSMDGRVLQVVAGALLVVVVRRLWAGATERARSPAGHAGLALWSFMMSSAHGAGLMLVPALIPLCMAGAPARQITASGSLTLALAAVGGHTAAMLAVTGAMAIGVCSGFDAGAGLLRRLGRWHRRRRCPPMPYRFEAPKLSSATTSAVTTMISTPQMATVRNGLKFSRLNADEMSCSRISAITRPPTLPKPPKGSTPPSTAARIVTSR
jgi:hypothetical protein